MIGHIALLGLPHAGKTAWLGRVSLGLLDAKGTALRADRPEDMRALRELSAWLDHARYPDRSPLQNAPELRLRLRWGDEHSPERIELHIADYNGEEVELIYTDRDPGWHRTWDARALARGLMVVVRPDQLRPMRARRLERGTAAQTDPAALFGAALMPDRDHRPDAAGVGAPTGVALVELIQLLRHIRGLSLGQHLPPDQLRVAVVFSCWDAVDPEQQALGPEHLLRERLGLLDDLLATNYPVGAVRCFGLSTTGGDLKDPAFLPVYEGGEPEDFGWVSWATSQGVQESPDISLPLAWMLEGDRVLDTAPRGRGGEQAG